jgi:hypothetical protein
MKCVICNTERKYINESKPCCNKCEKTAPTCISCPGLFTVGVPAQVARATEQEIRNQEAVKL